MMSVVNNLHFKVFNRAFMVIFVKRLGQLSNNIQTALKVFYGMCKAGYLG